MNWKIIGIVLGILILLGFIIPFILNILEGCSSACTLLSCPCTNFEEEDGAGRYERPCNTCQKTQRVFLMGLINVARKCSAQEIILCENGKNVDKRIGPYNCEIRFSFLWDLKKNEPVNSITQQVQKDQVSELFQQSPPESS